MLRINLVTSTARSKSGRIFVMEVQDAPWWKVLRGSLYHRYDMNVPKPVRWLLDQWDTVHPTMQEWGPALRQGESGQMEPVEGSKPLVVPMPWSVRQDYRCFKWNHHPVVYRAEIDREAYLALGGKFPD